MAPELVKLRELITCMAPELTKLRSRKIFELRSHFGSGAMAPELVQLRKKILNGSGAKVAPEPYIFLAPEL